MTRQRMLLFVGVGLLILATTLLAVFLSRPKTPDAHGATFLARQTDALR